MIKLGAAADVRESQMNPDSSSGLYVTAELRAAARRVATLKEQDKREKAEQAVRTASKNAELATRKREAFDRTIESIRRDPNKSICNGLTCHSPKTEIKLAFQHAGSRLGDYSNTKFSTYIEAILGSATYIRIFEDALSRTATSSSNSSSTNDESTMLEEQEEYFEEQEEDLVAVKV